MGALIESRVFSFFFSFLSSLNNSHKYALLEIVSSRIKKCDEEVHFMNKSGWSIGNVVFLQKMYRVSKELIHVCAKEVQGRAGSWLIGV